MIINNNINIIILIYFNFINFIIWPFAQSQRLENCKFMMVLVE